MRTTFQKLFEKQALLLIALALGQAFLLPAIAVFEPKSIETKTAAENYDITCHFIVKNKEGHAVENVKVFFPVPQDDVGQKIRNFNVNLNDKPWLLEKTTDQFGQPMLQATLPMLGSRKQAEIGYSCNVEITPYRVVLEKNKAGTIADIPKDIQAGYTNDLPGVYDMKAPVIQKTAAKFIKDFPNLVDRVQAIHDFVAENVVYNLSGHWSPAPVVLERKSGSCSEYSFLFASLCRATGLPTRMVGSSHLRTTTDFPYKDEYWHRWVEVYVPPFGWVPFDPTIDRGKPASQSCSGSYDFRTLRISRGGCESSILGQAYVGACSPDKAISIKKYFVWWPHI